MSFLTEFNNLLKCITEDISAGIISKDDSLKVIRKRKKYQTSPSIDYYYDNSIPSSGYDEMLGSDVLKEIMVELMKMR